MSSIIIKGNTWADIEKIVKEKDNATGLPFVALSNQEQALNSRITALENSINKSNHNVASNDKQLYDNLQELTQQVKALMDHNKNNAEIIDTMEDQIQKIITSHNPPQNVLHNWILVESDNFYMLNIGTPIVESVAYSPDYEIKYLKGTKYYRASSGQDNSDLTFTDTNGRLTITQKTAISKIFIYKLK